jgi:hypothetical protein
VGLKELRLEYRDIGSLKPYGRNPRKNDPAVRKMARSITEFGFAVPVLCMSSGEVIDGHLRLKAAESLGLRRVPVVLADGMSPAQVKAFRIAVNQSANWAKWDVPLLRMEIEDLRMEDFDLELLGFNASFFNDLELSDTLGGGVGFGDSGGDSGGEDGEREAGAGRGGKVPVTVVLGREDYGRWEEYKGSVGERSDTKAFLSLLEAAL